MGEIMKNHVDSIRCGRFISQKTQCSMNEVSVRNVKWRHAYLVKG